MRWVKDDGGRDAAGFKGTTGDCVVRAIAIATGVPYREVYDALNELAKRERPGRRVKRRSTSRNGVYRKTYEKYLKSLGWVHTPTMFIGQGCKVHFVEEELPKGRLIVSLSRHLTCVIDGVVHDTYNPQRGATYYYKPKPDGSGVELDRISPDRCVYGYYSKAEEA
jgi:hypothetical protein